MQTLLQAVPIPELDDSAVSEAKLEAVAALGSLRHIIGELIGLEVSLRNLTDHPLVQLLVGVFGKHKLVHGLGMGDLQVMIGKVFVGAVELFLRSSDLLVNLLKFFVRQVELVL